MTNFMVYEFEVADHVYTGKQKLLFPRSKTANFLLGEDAKSDDDGKQFSGRIAKKVFQKKQGQ